MPLVVVDVPEGMTAQVILGASNDPARRAPWAMPYDEHPVPARGRANPLPPAPEPEAKRRPGWLLSGLAGLTLLVAGFAVGAGLRPHHPAYAEMAPMRTPAAGPPAYIPDPEADPGPATTAFPLQAPPAPAASIAQPAATAAAAAPPADQMPPDIAADLQQKPQIQPAPGQTAGSDPHKLQNAFGLGD